MTQQDESEETSRAYGVPADTEGQRFTIRHGTRGVEGGEMLRHIRMETVQWSNE